ncbi:hypothetical protein [Stieleria sp.]|uniref:Uncharacterized protein n=1 Tax=Stieleria magnilauensis TaxID=2527963 RepID=A0ABX5XZB7_9BACT|nr:hypothetical protein TBK1r_41030 [Planctomycetes bacterium TBK1r]
MHACETTAWMVVVGYLILAAVYFATKVPSMVRLGLVTLAFGLLLSWMTVSGTLRSWCDSLS